MGHTTEICEVNPPEAALWPVLLLDPYNHTKYQVNHINKPAILGLTA